MADAECPPAEGAQVDVVAPVDAVDFHDANATPIDHEILSTPAGFGLRYVRYLVARPVLHELRNDDIFGRAVFGRRWKAIYGVFRKPAFNICGYVVWSAAVVLFSVFSCSHVKFGPVGIALTAILSAAATFYALVWDLCTTRTVTLRLMRSFEFWFIATQMVGFVYALSWLWGWDFRMLTAVTALKFGILHYLVADAMALGLRARVLERLAFAILPLIVAYVVVGARLGSQYDTAPRVGVADGYVDIRVIALDFCLNIIIFLTKYAVTLYKDRRNVILLHGGFKLQRMPMGTDTSIPKTEAAFVSTKLDVDVSATLPKGLPVMIQDALKASGNASLARPQLSAVPSASLFEGLASVGSPDSVPTGNAGAQRTADGALPARGQADGAAPNPPSQPAEVVAVARLNGRQGSALSMKSRQDSGLLHMDGHRVLSDDSGLTFDRERLSSEESDTIFFPVARPPLTTETTLPGVVEDERMAETSTYDGTPKPSSRTERAERAEKGERAEQASSATGTTANGGSGRPMRSGKSLATGSGKGTGGSARNVAPVPNPMIGPSAGTRRRYYLQSLAVEHKIDMSRMLGHAIFGKRAINLIWNTMRIPAVSFVLSMLWLSGALLSCLAVADVQFVRHPACLSVAAFGIFLHAAIVCKSNLDIMRLVARTFEFYFMLFENIGQMVGFIFYFRQDVRVWYVLFASTGHLMCTCFDAQSAKMRKSTKYAILLGLVACSFAFVAIYLRLFDKSDLTVTGAGFSVDVRLLLCNRLAVIALFYGKYFYTSARDSTALLILVAPCILTREIDPEAAVHRTKKKSSVTQPPALSSQKLAAGSQKLATSASSQKLATSSLKLVQGTAPSVPAHATTAWAEEGEAADPRPLVTIPTNVFEDMRRGEHATSPTEAGERPFLVGRRSLQSVKSKASLMRRLSVALSLHTLVLPNAEQGGESGDRADAVPVSAKADNTDDCDWDAYDLAMAGSSQPETEGQPEMEDV